MLILIGFAFLAGMVTIIAPCILPILPIVLSAGLTGGKRRPLGVITGLIISFTIVTLIVSYAVGHFGFSPDILRTIAACVLLVFGLVLVIPALTVRYEILVSHIVPQSSSNQGNGFWSGVLIGANLGLIWVPCSGPIMTSVIALAATQTVSINIVLITLAFAVGAAIPLLAVMYGSRAVSSRLQKVLQNTHLQTIFGIIMILTAIAIWTRFDQRIQANLLDTFPVLNKVVEIDDTQSVQQELQKLQ